MNSNILGNPSDFPSIKEYVEALAKFYKDSIPALSRYLEIFQFFGQVLKPIGEEAKTRFYEEIGHAELDHEFHNAYMNSLFNHELVVMTGFKRNKDGSISACWFNGVKSVPSPGPNCSSAFNAPVWHGLIDEAEEYYGFIMPAGFITEYRLKSVTTLQLILWYLKVYGPSLPFMDEPEINPEDGFPFENSEAIKQDPVLQKMIAQANA